MNTYDEGQTVRLEADFTSGGAPVDPDSVVCRVMRPNGTETSGEATQDATGRYSFKIVVDQDGYWAYRFEGTGTFSGVEEGEFKVRRSEFRFEEATGE
jgi:hypothetical protein